MAFDVCQRGFQCHCVEHLPSFDDENVFSLFRFVPHLPGEGL